MALAAQQQAADTATLLGVQRSVLGRRWIARGGDDRLGLALAQRLSVPEIVGRMMAARGVDLDSAASFLNPTLRDLLPEVPYRSPMEIALRRFLDGRSADGVPEHRRVDPERVRLRARNRAGKVSIELLAEPGQLAYAVEKAVKLLNEIFLSFLAGPYDAYMVRVFGAPEE